MYVRYSYLYLLSGFGSQAKLAEMNAHKLAEEERARQEYAFDPEEPVNYEGDT